MTERITPSWMKLLGGLPLRVAGALYISFVITHFLPSYHNGHVGKIILDTLKSKPNELHHIDVVNGLKETHGSVRTRTIRTARALRARGLRIGDIVMISAMTHNDSAIPLLASMYIGTIPVALTTGMTYDEIEHIVELAKPNIVFCDDCMVDIINKVFEDSKIKVEIIVFDSGSNRKYLSFDEFLQEVADEEYFECVEFDPATTTAVNVCSSGTTGLFKLVAITHEVLTIMHILPMQHNEERFFNSLLSFSHMCWISGIFGIIGSSIVGYTLLQSSEHYTPELACHAIETYKPEVMIMAPMAIYELVKYPNIRNRDFSSLKLVFSRGGTINRSIIDELKNYLTNGDVVYGFGSTEGGNISANFGYVRGSIGKLNPWVEWKIVNQETGESVGPYATGELCIKSVMLFQKYYNDPIETKKAFDEENYYKTGDLLYYDKEGYFYYVDRCKEIIKYSNNQISTVELENKICNIPQVLAACVVGIPAGAYGDHPMAFVQLVAGSAMTAKEIKDFIKDSLSDYKQLRGGVVFLDKLPLTHSGKVNRKLLNAMKHDVKGE